MKPKLDKAGKKKYYQGIYKLKNPEKYIGDPNNVIYRSGLEKRWYKYVDENPDIVKFASEEMYVPYISPVDGRMHRYFIDMMIETINGEKFAIEIKPESQTKEPKKPSRQTKRYITEAITYQVNLAKWDAATKFCQSKGMKFIIITDKMLPKVL